MNNHTTSTANAAWYFTNITIIIIIYLLLLLLINYYYDYTQNTLTKRLLEALIYILFMTMMHTFHCNHQRTGRRKF